jgi:hypothetical protein
MHYFILRKDKVIYIDTEGDCSGIFEADYLHEPVLSELEELEEFKKEALKYISENEFELAKNNQIKAVEIGYRQWASLFREDLL